ncbi:MAG: hypothetical protein ABSA18_16545 [Dehalococcoidia bacterium]
MAKPTSTGVRETKKPYVARFFDKWWKLLIWMICLIVLVSVLNLRITDDQLVKSINLAFVFAVALIFTFSGAATGNILYYTCALVILIIGIWIFVTKYPDYNAPINAWTNMILAFSTIMVTVAAFLAYNESKIQRKESQLQRNQDEERESKKRRLYELEEWINSLLQFNNIGILVPDSSDTTKKLHEARILVTKKVYLIAEVKRIDTDMDIKEELRGKYKLEEIVETLINEIEIGIKNPPQLFSSSLYERLDKACDIMLEAMSEIKADLKL